MSIADKFEVIADAVYEKGKQAEKERFFDDYIAYKNSDLTYGFYKWSKDCYHPHSDIVCEGEAGSLYSYSNIEDTKVNITFTGSTMNNCFYYANKMKTVKNIILPANVTPSKGTFRMMTALENITFSGEGKLIGTNGVSFEHSSRLTRESIDAILGALYLGASGSLTLSQRAVDSWYSAAEWESIVAELAANNWSTSLI